MTAARKHSAPLELLPDEARWVKARAAAERIAADKPTPPKKNRGVGLAPPTLSTAGNRDLDADDEYIITLCGRRIERHAGRMTRGLTDHETGEVRQVEQRTREFTYTLFEPVAAGARYEQVQLVAGVRWGAAHTLIEAGRWPDYRAAVEAQMRQQARATTVILGVCRELAAMDGVGGMVLQLRGEMFLSGSVRPRYERAMSKARPAHV